MTERVVAVGVGIVEDQPPEIRVTDRRDAEEVVDLTFVPEGGGEHVAHGRIRGCLGREVRPEAHERLARPGHHHLDPEPAARRTLVRPDERGEAPAVGREGSDRGCEPLPRKRVQTLVRGCGGPGGPAVRHRARQERISSSHLTRPGPRAR